jgi:hypothetical protein
MAAVRNFVFNFRFDVSELRTIRAILVHSAFGADGGDLTCLDVVYEILFASEHLQTWRRCTAVRLHLINLTYTECVFQ